MSTKSDKILEQLLSALPESLLTGNNKLDTLLLEVWSQSTRGLTFALYVTEVLNLLDYNDISSLLSSLHSLYHSAKLFDDIVDQDKDYSIVTEQGVATGANLGLLLLTFAYNNLLQFCYNNKIKHTDIILLLQNVFANVFTMAKAQSVEFEEAQIIVSEEEYLAHLSGKSGSFLEMTCSVLASLANLPRPQVEKLSRFGHYIGLLSQLLNDLNSCVVSDLKRNSLAQGIVTLPVIYALNIVDKETNLRIQQLWQTPNKTVAETETLYNLLRQSGAFQLLVMKLAVLFNEATELVNSNDPIDVQLLLYLTNFQKSLSQYL